MSLASDTEKRNPVGSGERFIVASWRFKGGEIAAIFLHNSVDHHDPICKVVLDASLKDFPCAGSKVIEAALPLAWELEGMLAGIAEGPSNQNMEVDGLRLLRIARLKRPDRGHLSAEAGQKILEEL